MTRSTVAAANEIDQLSQVANANPEAFQRWAAASATVGIEQEMRAWESAEGCGSRPKGAHRVAVTRAAILDGRLTVANRKRAA